MNGVPKSFRLIYNRSQIEKRIAELGQEIGKHAKQLWQETGQDFLAIPVLRGGLFFFSHLVQEVDSSVEIAPARAWGYEANSLADGITIDLSHVPAQGRAILLVDDI